MTRFGVWLARRDRLRFHARLERAARQRIRVSFGDEFVRARDWLTELVCCPDPSECDHVRRAGR